MDIRQNSNFVKSTVSLSIPLFQTIPSSVVFSDYKPFNIYKQEISFKNLDSVPRRLFVDKIDDSFFTVVLKNGNSLSGKIAPGMSVEYIITFKPQEKKDYYLNLKCTSEREIFYINISANGPRPLIIFPDQIDMEKVPIKIKTSKSLLVQNTGDGDAVLSIKSEYPFNLTTDSLIIKSFELKQLNLEVTAEHIKEYKGKIIIEYGGTNPSIIEVRAQSIEVIEFIIIFRWI